MLRPWLILAFLVLLTALNPEPLRRSFRRMRRRVEEAAQCVTEPTLCAVPFMAAP